MSRRFLGYISLQCDIICVTAKKFFHHLWYFFPCVMIVYWGYQIFCSIIFWNVFLCVLMKTKVLNYLSQCIFLWYDFIHSIKEGIVLFFDCIFLCYNHMQRIKKRCCIIFLNAYFSIMILFKASNKAVQFLCECILLFYDYMHSVKDSDVILCIPLKKLLQYFFEIILLFYNYMQSIK